MRLLQTAMLGLLLPCAAYGATVVQEVGGQTSFGFTVRVKTVATFTRCTSVAIRVPVPVGFSAQSYDQTVSWTATYSDAPTSQSSGSYWHNARWDFPTQLDGERWVEITMTGSGTAKYPSFPDDNFTWYGTQYYYMASTTNAQVTPAIDAVAQSIYIASNAYEPYGRMGDLEAISSWTTNNIT